MMFPYVQSLAVGHIRKKKYKSDDDIPVSDMVLVLVHKLDTLY